MRTPQECGLIVLIAARKSLSPRPMFPLHRHELNRPWNRTEILLLPSQIPRET